MPITDFKTNKPLAMKTELYYAFQNQQTLKYLVWCGNSGTVATAPVKTDPQYWHVFAKLAAPAGNYYRFTHGLPASNCRHVSKIAAAPVKGYVMLWNRDCGDDNNPNVDDNGFINCVSPNGVTAPTDINKPVPLDPQCGWTHNGGNALPSLAKPYQAYTMVA
ncbi:unnamed protein product, partial [Medioppia subpectinata]